MLGASWLSRAWKGRQGMGDVNQSRQITAEAITAKARHAQDHGGRPLHEPQGTGKRPWAHKRRQDKAELGSTTDPYPLPSVRAPLGACAIRAGLLSMVTSDEAPHLIALHLRDRQVPQQVGIDLMSVLCGSPQPLQDGCFRYTQDQADVRKGHLDQQHLQGHEAPVFRTPQVKEDGVARLGNGTLTLATAEDTSLATRRHIGGYGTKDTQQVPRGPPVGRGV